MSFMNGDRICKISKRNTTKSSSDEKPITCQQDLASIAATSLKLSDKIKETKSVLDYFGILSEISIVAAHRAPKKTHIISELESKAFDIVIAVADG
jgi:hypothetical protein